MNLFAQNIVFTENLFDSIKLESDKFFEETFPEINFKINSFDWKIFSGLKPKTYEHKQESDLVEPKLLSDILGSSKIKTPSALALGIGIIGLGICYFLYKKKFK